MAHEERDERPPSDDPVEPIADERGGLEEDLRVQRSEEELHAGVRESEAGSMNVKKRVRTEREVVRVPKRREEVGIERVPIEGEASEADIGEDEVMVQVFEQEVVVTMRVVLKEEIRLRKRVVEEDEVIEVDLRKEEVEMYDQTKPGAEVEES
ncbi:MAG: DUF2382 domain-containing protein [Rubrobacteraceae bacterium]|nr:DUF2382 domain-containing protein [Rubrobacteraceae bacterium]